MEYLDIVDRDGLPTGEIVSREEAHKNGIRHRTAHVWVIRSKKDGFDILLQKRSENSESFPGMFDTSSAGHIPAGDEPMQSALREIHEELGINASENQFQYIGKFSNSYQKIFRSQLFFDNEVTWVYLYSEPIDINKISLQESEVSEVRWFDLNEVWDSVCSQQGNFCVSKNGLTVLMNHCYNKLYNKR